MILKKELLIFVCSFLTLISIIQLVFANDYELLDKIIATVEKDVVTAQEVKKEFNRRYPNKNQLSKNELIKIEKEVLDSLITKKLVLQYAELINLNPSEQEIDMVIKNIIQNNQITYEDLEKELLRDGSNILEFKEQLRFQITLQKIKDREIMPYVNISQYEIDAELEKQNNNNNQNNQYKLSHILIKQNNPNKEIIIKEILTLENSKNFSELAKKYSQGPNAEKFGDLGWNKLEDLPEIFIDFVSKAEDGQISNPIESSNGYHIIRLDSSKKINSNKQIFIKQYKFQQVLLKKNYINSDTELEKKLENIKNLIIDGLNFSKAVSLYSEDQSQPNADNLSWVDFDNLLPEFRNELSNYPEKKIIGPFKTEIGLHLIKVYDFREFDITNESNKQKVKIELARKKTEIRFDDWLDSLIKNSSITYIEN